MSRRAGAFRCRFSAEWGRGRLFSVVPGMVLTWCSPAPPEREARPFHCVLEQELKATPTVASHPLPSLSCPRLLLASCFADAKNSLGNLFSCSIRLLQSFFLLSRSSLCWAACPGGRWGAEEARAAVLTYCVCLLLAGAGSSKGVQDPTACSRPHVCRSPGAGAEHPSLRGILLPFQPLPASGGGGQSGVMGLAAPLSGSCSRSPKQ